MAKAPRSSFSATPGETPSRDAASRAARATSWSARRSASRHSLMLAPCNECQGAKLDARRTENPRPFVQFLGALVVFCTFLLLLSGCGGSSNLDSEQTITVAQFNADVASVVLDGAHYGRLLNEIDGVIAIARDDPQAVYQVSDTDPKVTMRQVLSDAAAALGPYQPDLAAKLDRAVQTLE